MLAAFPGLGDEELDAAARRLTACTHQHELAQEAAVVTARLCRRLINGHEMEEALLGIDNGIHEELQRSIAASIKEPGGIGGYSPETLQSALHFVITRNSFDDALADALKYAGPPNYCPVLVGAIAGARWGSEVIGSSHLDHCLDRARVESVASRLPRSAQGSNQGEPGDKGELPC